MSYYIALMIGASVLVMAAWTVLFRDQNRVGLFLTSIWLFAFPISFLVFDNYFLGLLWAVPYIAVIALEEFLKLIGSKIVRNEREAFALVLLFGVWEIVITKTVRVFFQDPSFYAFLGSNYVKYSIVSLTSFLMHSTTAAIYALLRTRNWLIPFSLAMLLHTVFNYTRDFYFYVEGDQTKIHFWLIFVEATCFALVWLALWRFYRRLTAHRSIHPGATELE